MSGRLYGIGVGPGDPELLTLKAHRILAHAPVVAYPAPDDGNSFARGIVAQYLRPDQLEIPIVIAMRVERFPAREVYDRAAAEIAGHLRAGTDVVVLCEGDPFFYGSFMYLFERLAGEFSVEIVPGVSSLMACAAQLGRPLAARNDVLSVIPAPLPDERIMQMLQQSDAVAIMKVGRHFQRICSLVEKSGLMGSSGYVERAGLPQQKVCPLASVKGDSAPYFSMILIYKGQEQWISELGVAGSLRS